MCALGSSPCRSRGIVGRIVELFMRGFSARDIAKAVYGSDDIRMRRRVYRMLWYAKVTGKLSTVSDYRTGDVVLDGVVVREREVGETFINHSHPVTNAAPFLGSYRNMRQLKASLRRDEVRAVNVMSVVDRLLGPLDISHDSVVREEAMLLARKFASRGRVREVASAAVFTAVVHYRPGFVRELVEVLVANGVDKLPLSLIVDMFTSVLGRQ